MVNNFRRRCNLKMKIVLRYRPFIWLVSAHSSCSVTPCTATIIISSFHLPLLSCSEFQCRYASLGGFLQVVQKQRNQGMTGSGCLLSWNYVPGLWLHMYRWLGHVPLLSRKPPMSLKKNKKQTKATPGPLYSQNFNA